MSANVRALVERLQARLPACLEGVVPSWQPWARSDDGPDWSLLTLRDARGIEMFVIGRRVQWDYVYVRYLINPWVLSSAYAQTPCCIPPEDTADADAAELARVIRCEWEFYL